MSDRQAKLDKIRAKQAALTIVTDGQPIIDSLDEKIEALKNIFGGNLKVDIDDLLNELGNIGSFENAVKDLKDTIKSFEIPIELYKKLEMPESVGIKGLDRLNENIAIQNNLATQIVNLEIPKSIEIKGLDRIVEIVDKQSGAIGSIDIPKSVKLEGIKDLVVAIRSFEESTRKSQQSDTKISFDQSGLIEINKRLGDLLEVATKNVVSQDAADFMPTRRVVKIGNQLVFDDSISGGSGGSGGIARDLTRVNATAIAVVNPDGSNIGGGSGGSITNDGTFATPERQDTGNTSLSTIAGAISSSVVQENMKQINGTAPLMGNGVTGTGSQRVTIASDNTPFPVKTDQTTHGTTDLVASDQIKIAGTIIDTNSGNKSAGTQRIVLATDQPQLTNSLKVDGSGVTQPINASSLPLPSGAATSANQSTEITSLSTIATNTGNGATSTNQTNGVQQTRLTDGTNIANVIAADTGYNGASIGNTTKTLTFTTNTPGAQNLLADTDCRGYSWIEIIYTSVGSGLAASGQFSPNSGGTYIGTATWQTSSAQTSSAGTLGATVNLVYYSAVQVSFFQLRLTALTSGTASGYVILHSLPRAYASVGANTYSGATIGAATPVNAFLVGGTDGTNLRSISLSTVGVVDVGLMPARTSLNTYSVRLTTNATTTPTSSTAYISSIVISSEVGGTTSTVTIQDKQGTPLKLINASSTTGLTTIPTTANFQTPIKMTSGIDIITAGAVAATIDVWINYYQ